MKKIKTTLLIILSLLIISFTQTNKTIIYNQTISYIKNTKTINSLIKKELGKKAIEFKVSNKLIRIELWMFKEKLSKMNGWINNPSLSDSSLGTMPLDFPKDSIVNGLSKLTKDSLSNYTLSFSPLVDSLLECELHMDSRMVRTQNSKNSGSILTTGFISKGIRILFILNKNGNVEKAIPIVMTYN